MILLFLPDDWIEIIFKNAYLTFCQQRVVCARRDVYAKLMNITELMLVLNVHLM